MNKLLSLAVTIGLVLSSCTTTPMAPPQVISDVESNAILKTGFSHVERAIVLRDKLAKNGVKFYKAKHIQELEAELPILANYYRKAVKDQPAKKELIEKVLKQMQEEFKKKSMSLHKWNLFHEQFNTLFSPPAEVTLAGFAPGKLDFKKSSYEKFSESFPCFAYVNDGVLGLQTLNFAFAHDIMILAMPTDKFLLADGIERNAFAFTIHDAAHFSSFKESPYFFKRFRDKSLALYHAIEKQNSTMDRMQDHLVFFMLIHEFPFSGSDYPEDFAHVLRKSTAALNGSMRYSFPSIFDQNKQLVFNALRNEEIFEPDSINIESLPPSQYLITGQLKSNPGTSRSLVATVTGQNEKGLSVVEYRNLQGQMVKATSSGSQYADLVPLIELMNEARTGLKSNINAANSMKQYSRDFLNKYATAGA